MDIVLQTYVNRNTKLLILVQQHFQVNLFFFLKVYVVILFIIACIFTQKSWAGEENAIFKGKHQLLPNYQ